MKRASFSLLTLILTIGFFLPSFILFNNNQSFPTQHFDILKLLPLYSIGLYLLLLIPIHFTSKNRPERLNGLTNFLLLLNILIVAEAYFMNWDLGILDGTELNTDHYGFKIAFDLSIWILIGFLFFKKKWSKSDNFLNIVLIGIQVSFFLTSFFNQAFVYPDFAIESKNKFHFSKKQNVLILTLDGYQSNVFKDVLDHRPELKENFKDFTYFQNSLSNFSQTVDSVTSLLSESYINEKMPRNLFMYKNFKNKSISKVLKEHGFRAELHPYGTHEIFCDISICDNWTGSKLSRRARNEVRIKLFDLTLYRIVPLIIKKQIFTGETGFFEASFSGLNLEVPILASKSSSLSNLKPSTEKFSSSLFLKNIKLTPSIDDFPSSLNDEKIITNFHRFLRELKNNSKAYWETPVFKYYHQQGLHSPQNIDKDLNYKEWPRSKRAVYEQALASLRVAVLFIKQLQKLEIYNNALIFIISDHGYGKDGITVGERDQTLDERKVDLIHKSRAIPLILVKRIGEIKKTMNISQAPVMLTDIPKTIVDELGISTDVYKQDSFFKIPEVDKRRRTTFNFHHMTDSKGYLYDKFEYSVEGHSWDNSSWYNANPASKGMK